MAKSLGNFYTLADLSSRGHSPLAYRYLLLTAHYRTPLNFSFETLAGAERAWRKVNELVFSLPQGGKVDEKAYSLFMTAINDDLNTAKGLAILHDTLGSDLPGADKQATIKKFDEILGILDQSLVGQDEIPEEILSLSQDREVARDRGDFTRADLIRGEMEAKGYSVKDTATGPQIKKI
jgi:cysteinyl-tRNA synthetase